MEAEYNIADFRRPDPGSPGAALDNADLQPTLHVGKPAPDFDLVSVDGGRVRLSDVTRDRHVALIFGAITSPVTATTLPELNRLYEYFRWRGVEFLFIYTREPHPGDVYPHHTSMEQKIGVARELQKLEEIRFPVLVDELDGRTHLAYGPSPNPAFVVGKNGRLMYRARHADASTLKEYLEHLLLWDQVQAQGLPTHNMYLEEVRFIIPDGPLHKKIVSRAGPKAVREMQASFGESSHLT